MHELLTSVNEEQERIQDLKETQDLKRKLWKKERQKIIERALIEADIRRDRARRQMEERELSRLIGRLSEGED